MKYVTVKVIVLFSRHHLPKSVPQQFTNLIFIKRLFKYITEKRDTVDMHHISIGFVSCH